MTTGIVNRVLKNVASDGRTRRERAKKRSLLGVNRFATPHFEPLSNAVMPSAVVSQHPVSARTWQLLNILADGEFHAGEVLANRLGVSRASVFNALAGVADYGVLLQRIRGRGYRMARPWQRLEQSEVARWLGKDAGRFDIEILPQAASSNTLLLQRAGLDVANGRAPAGSVLAVELQTAGRGRMGRIWHSGLGTALTFSLLW